MLASLQSFMHKKPGGSGRCRCLTALSLCMPPCSECVTKISLNVSSLTQIGQHTPQVPAYISHWLRNKLDFSETVSKMESCVGLPLPTRQLKELADNAKDYATTHGLLTRKKEDPTDADNIRRLSVMLLPCPVPLACFSEACALQVTFNSLIHKVAHNYDFLKECLKNTIKVDKFTSRLWSIYEVVRKEGITQPIALGILRSDYMLDGGVPTSQLISGQRKVDLKKVQIKQVEINTIACSSGCLSSHIYPYYRYALHKLGIHDQGNRIPESHAETGLAEAFLSAWVEYGQSDAVILFVVQEQETNIMDQRLIEYAVFDLDPRVKFIRRTLEQLRNTCLGDKKQLMVEEMEVAVVYFRALYRPNDLKTEMDWNVRLRMEQSLAIKCPPVYYQLAGTKKVQQVLTQPGVLERFVSDSKMVKRIIATFASQYSLDMGDEGDQTVALALRNPEKFVLKPQREGGGNNCFGDDICTVLEKVGKTEERTAYVLMERIQPVTDKNYPLFSSSEVSSTPLDMVSEIGIYGIILGSPDKLIVNKQQGNVLKAMPYGRNEGGLNAGFGALGSPYLI